MIAGSLARRYGKALVSLGAERNQHDALGAEISAIARTLEISPELRRLLDNPVFPLGQRRAVVEALLGRLSTSRTVRAFVMILLDRGRVALLPAIVREHRALADEHLGRVRAVLTSARPLDPGVEDRIRATLSRRTGKTVLSETRQDRSLLGGLKVQIGDVLYDGSVHAELLRIREQLLSA